MQNYFFGNHSLGVTQKHIKTKNNKKYISNAENRK